MSSPIISQSNTKAGLCPHGLPPAACPICSAGASMKSSAPVKLKEKPQPKISASSAEWSWMKCYAAGLAIKANEARKENAQTFFERKIEFAKQLNKNIQKLSENIKQSLERIKDSLPKVFKPFIQFSLNVINNFANIISKLPILIEKLSIFQKNTSNMILNISEKILAIAGDIKNFIDRKIVEDLKKKAKKIFTFFTLNIDDENYKNDDTLAVFKSREIKKYIIKINAFLKKRNDNANGKNKK